MDRTFKVFALACVLAVPALPAAAGEPAAAPAARSAPAGGWPAGVTPGLVDGPTARRLAAAGVKVLDVRTPEEFAQGHVPGAVNIPYDQVAARHAELGPPSTPVLVYCRSGRRSGVAAQALRERGFAAVYDLQRYDAWQEDARP